MEEQPKITLDFLKKNLSNAPPNILGKIVHIYAFDYPNVVERFGSMLADLRQIYGENLAETWVNLLQRLLEMPAHEHKKLGRECQDYMMALTRRELPPFKI